MTEDCSQNLDPLRLVREGTTQDDRVSAALDPASAPVNARGVADHIVFAQSYAKGLKHYDKNNLPDGDWGDYFGSDAAVPLATAAIEDIDAYKTTLRSWFDFLNNFDNNGQGDALRDRLGYLYAAAGGLALALDGFTQRLPDTVPLKGTVRNLVKNQLAAAFKRLIAYYKGGQGLGVIHSVAPAPEMHIFTRAVGPFDNVLSAGLSTDWSDGAVWATYEGAIAQDVSVYGPGGAPDPFVRINHCATHTLFRSIFDQFLKAFMRVVSEAKLALNDMLTNFPGHAPHYALYLAFLELMEYARTAGNRLTQKHLDFYYRTILGLKERPAQPGYVHLLAQVAKQADTFDFQSGRLFKAGKDSTGKDAFFANVADFVANKASIAAKKTVYRHGIETVGSKLPHPTDEGRIFASPTADSSDGQGAPLITPDKSWHPFFNKIYVDGALSEIAMPEASIGFAMASHYLLMAEGKRTITLRLTTDPALPADFDKDRTSDVRCRLTSAKGWIDKTPAEFVRRGANLLELVVRMTGADDGVAPYSLQVHGYNFSTTLPVLLVELVQDDARPYGYAGLQDVRIATIEVTVEADGVKTLAAANDFGPVDLSKPFQPFGSSPTTGSSFVIGSKEIFQKKLQWASIDLTWQTPPVVYPPPPAGAIPSASIQFLKAGEWEASGIPPATISNGGGSGEAMSFALDANLADPVLDTPDYSANEAYSTQSRQGYVQLTLNGDFGQSKYQSALIDYIKGGQTGTAPPPPQAPPTAPGGQTGKAPVPPQAPIASALTLSYAAESTLDLNTADAAKFANRPGQFFHLAPFGSAEQHPYLTGGDNVALLPQFSLVRAGATLPSEAEFYIGVSGLTPPQSLSILFQVADGTANPLAPKPKPHIDWCYLSNNLWMSFPENAVADATGELLVSGIVTFAMPANARSDNTLLPSGMHWIRVAVSEASDAVCRLLDVALQAMEAVFFDQGNAPGFSATSLPPQTISKLAAPDAAVKSIRQPYPSFGGRGAEAPPDFYRRVSERLRHKDRAIDLWDHERLILQAFPQIFKVRCLNHTQFEPAEAGSSDPCTAGIYRELAPGHVTIVTLPDLKTQQQIDPFKPYTSLGLLGDIATFLQKRNSCLVKLHVRNPQFEEVRVAFKLKLHDGYDAAYYAMQLQQAITRFLSPWAFTGLGAPSFGGKIYKAVLINFVENLRYVDYVTDFQLFHDVPCDATSGSADLDEVTGSRAVSILVSAPASKHQISIIVAAPDQALAESCGCGA
jgi:hypothetical protein